MTSTLATAVQALRDAPRAVYRASGDASLLELTRLAGEARRLADLHLALATGELARRSSHEAGRTGLVQREGARSVEEYLKSSTGMTGRDAVVTVRIGRLASEGDLLGTRVVEGSISVPAAEAIRARLAGAEAAPEVLAEATAQLCDEAPKLDPDRLLRRAREVRDEQSASISSGDGRAQAERRARPLSPLRAG